MSGSQRMKVASDKYNKNIVKRGKVTLGGVSVLFFFFY